MTTSGPVHDVNGRPVYRLATQAHDSLGKLLEAQVRLGHGRIREGASRLGACSRTFPGS